MSIQTDNHVLLVPLDGSAVAEQAIPVAAVLAGADGRLVFVQVIPGVEPVRDLVGRVSIPEEAVEDQEEARAAAVLRATAERWRGILPGEPEIAVEVGDPADRIVRLAEERGATLIVAASHGRGAFGRLAFGSVADALSRTAACPVLIVRARPGRAEMARPGFARVLVPTDGSELAAAAYPVATALAGRLHAPVHLLRAVSAVGIAPFSPLAEPYPVPLAEEAMEEAEDEAQAALDAAASRVAASGVPVTTELAIGSPVEVIEERTRPDDLIVLASHRRSGVERWLLGSMAESLVREGRAPVVLVPARAD